MNLTTQRSLTIIIALVSIILSMVFVWISTSVLSTTWKIFFSTIGTIILTSGVFSLLGAYLARIEISKYLVERFGINEVLAKAGIEEVTDWPVQFPVKALKIDILVARGYSWIDLEAPALFENLDREGCEIRICIVHPKSEMVKILSNKYDEDVEDAKNKIISTIKTIVQFTQRRKTKKSLPGRLILKAHYLPTPYTYYRFDDKVYLLWYAFRRGRFSLPCLKLKYGSLSTFFRDDFDRLLEETDVATIYDSKAEDIFNIQLLKKVGLTEENCLSLNLHSDKNYE